VSNFPARDTRGQNAMCQAVVTMETPVDCKVDQRIGRDHTDRDDDGSRIRFDIFYRGELTEDRAAHLAGTVC